MRALLTEHVLAAAGCVVRTLTDSRELAESLQSFQPDLILTAAPLAPASGVELAAVCRGADTVRVVPILVAAVDHRRQPRVDPVGTDAAADGSALLAPDLLVGAVTRRIESMRAIPQALPVAADVDVDSDAALATRRHFMHGVGCAIDEPDIGEPGNGLLVVALDGVSHLNERLGIGAADLAADRIGQLIVECLGQTDLAVRLDDYRHAVLVRRAGAEALEGMAESLRRAITDAPFLVDGHPITTSVSIGIGLFRPPPDDAVTMIKRAEHACAQAAIGGGNRIVIDRPVAAGAPDEARDRLISQLIERALLLTQLIERAVIDADAVGGFQVLYQPMVAIGRQLLHHVEVTLCLDAEDGTFLQAMDFLPVAERAGRLPAIDRWMMLRCLEVLTRQGPIQPRLRLFIRQHVESLMQDGWLSWFGAQLLADDLAKRAPILDLDLHDLLRHRHLAGTLIAALRKIGVQVCLVGVDHTPVALELVKELHPAFVKLAPSAPHQLKSDRLNHLVQRLNHCEAEVIACGIDAHELVAPVWASGVGYAQGAVFYAPRADLVFDWDEVGTEELA